MTILSFGLVVLFFLFVFMGGQLKIGSGLPFELNFRTQGVVPTVYEIKRNVEINDNFRRKYDRSN